MNDIRKGMIEFVNRRVKGNDCGSFCQLCAGVQSDIAVHLTEDVAKIVCDYINGRCFNGEVKLPYPLQITVAVNTLDYYYGLDIEHGKALPLYHNVKRVEIVLQSSRPVWFIERMEVSGKTRYITWMHFVNEHEELPDQYIYEYDE